MESKEQQLMELLSLTARSLTHLTASMTSMSFELMRSNDEVTKGAGRRMIDRMATISTGLDEHWRLIGELTGVIPLHYEVSTWRASCPGADRNRSGNSIAGPAWPPAQLIRGSHRLA